VKETCVFFVLRYGQRKEDEEKRRRVQKRREKNRTEAEAEDEKRSAFATKRNRMFSFVSQVAIIDVIGGNQR